MNLVDADVVEKYLAEYELEMVQSDVENVKTLTDYFAERGKSEGITLAQCDCGGTSDAELEECPFCGDSEPVDGLTEEDEDDDSEETAESDADADDEEEDDEDDDDEPEAAAESEDEDDEEEEDEDDEEEDDPEPTPAPKKKAKGKKAKKAAKKVTKATADKKAAKKKKQPKDAKKTKKGKPAKKEKGPLEDQEATPSSARKPGETSTDIVVFTTADLDEQVKVIKSTGKFAATELLKMGSAFDRIHTDELWKLRTVKGKPKYTNFKKFVAEEFGVSHTYAYGLMDVARKFTEDDVKRLGISKLRVALQVPAERQKEILDAAKKGATVADLKDKARKDRPEAKKAITVALLLGQQVVPAFKRTDPDVRASKIKDDAFGELELDNGVTLSIKLTRDVDSNLQFVVEAKRGAAE
jgi:hypothetical protein